MAKKPDSQKIGASKQTPAPRRSAIDRILGHLGALDRRDLGSVAARLGRERELLEKILLSLQDAVIVVDRWGAIDIINPAALRMLGLPDDTSPSLWRAVPELGKILRASPDSPIHLPAPLAHEVELAYPTPRLVRLQASPIVGDATDPTDDRLLIVLSDITSEREGATRQVEEARLGALTQLAAGVAHELGNPINALEIHLQLISRALQKERIQSVAIDKSLHIAQDELKRLDHIIRHFLQAIRPTPPNLAPTDIMSLLEEVLTVLRAELEGAHIAIRVELPGLLPPVMADSAQIKQVYFNIIKNAREAMESGGTLRIRATADDEQLHVHFVDSGSGIRSEDLSHIFEPYHTTKPGGTGLGMMIAQKIMRAHGGTIRVESAHGQGTTVTLSWPLQYRRMKPLTA